MEAAAYLQRDGAASGGLDCREERGHLLRRGGDGDLAGAVEVDGVDLGKVCAEGYDGVWRELQHGGHRGIVGLCGLLHVLRAAADKRKSRFKIHCAAVGQRGQLAKGKAGGHVGPDAGLA